MRLLVLLQLWPNKTTVRKRIISGGIFENISKNYHRPTDGHTDSSASFFGVKNGENLTI
jgi:hypothetical protein